MKKIIENANVRGAVRKGVLAYEGGHNKIPQTVGLNNRHVFSHSSQKLQNLKKLVCYLLNLLTFLSLCKYPLSYRILFAILNSFL